MKEAIEGTKQEITKVGRSCGSVKLNSAANEAWSRFGLVVFPIVCAILTFNREKKIKLALICMESN